MDYWAQDIDGRPNERPDDLYAGTRLQVVAESGVMKELLHMLKRAAETDSMALFWGEKGTGKERLARCLHARSPRRARPFLMVSCPALSQGLTAESLFGPAGLFVRADRGTVFLKGVETLSPSAQAQLTQALECASFREADVRILAAAGTDIRKLVKQERFSEELYYLLNVIELPVPPVRNRREDIIPICQCCLEALNLKYGQKKFLTKSAQTALQRYHWPGNLREIRNVVERAFVLSHFNSISAGDLPDGVVSEKGRRTGDWQTQSVELSEFFQQPYREAMKHFERLYLSEALSQYRGNVSQTAKALRISRSDLYYKIQTYFPESIKKIAGKE